MRAIPLSTCLLLWGVALHGQDSYSQTGHTAKHDRLTWGPAPAIFPAGAKMAVAPIAAVITLCPKQSSWKLLAQFSLSRERDVANIIA